MAETIFARQQGNMNLVSPEIDQDASRCGSVYSARKESPLCEHRNTACEVYSTNPEMMEMMAGIYSSTREVRPSLQMNVGIQE